MNLLFGASPRRITLLLALISGITLGLFALLLQNSLQWNSIVTAILAVDIGAGLVSNASTSTNEAWKAQSHARQWVFVVFHLTIYPLAILLLSSSNVVTVTLITVLLIKTGLFFIRVLYPSLRRR